MREIYAPSTNPYYTRLIALRGASGQNAYCDHETEAHRGYWRSKFLAPTEKQKLHVELGCNAGHVVLEWAKQRSAERFVGIDWKFKQVYRLHEKITENQVQNLLTFRANQERLPEMFSPHEIDHLYLFCPDPWPKRVHNKNRIFQEPWLRKIHPLVKTEFYIKTDHREYFDQMRAVTAACADLWEVVDESFDLHAGNPDAKKLRIPDVTLFERMFIRDGLPIHMLRLRPKPMT
jgi:tRNA (guanine-N7-)-methyltransferase